MIASLHQASQNCVRQISPVLIRVDSKTLERIVEVQARRCLELILRSTQDDRRGALLASKAASVSPVTPGPDAAPDDRAAEYRSLNPSANATKRTKRHLPLAVWFSSLTSEQVRQRSNGPRA